MVETYKKYMAYEVEDITSRLSAILNFDVDISDVEMILYDYYNTNELSFDITIKGKDYWDYTDQAPSELFPEFPTVLYLEEKYIFAFDTSLFGSYLRCVVGDD